jgi:hypothetical protein
MRMNSVQLWAAAAILVVSVGCNRTAERQGEPGAAGTVGRSGGAASDASTVLTGCLERNLQSGQFELVMTGDAARRAGNPNAGMQPGNDRLVLTTAGDVELTQYVGHSVTVEGTLGAGQPVTDAGTRSYGAGEGADASQTRSREDDGRRMTVNAVTNVAERCPLEKR